jgi:hypothetical protein
MNSIVSNPGLAVDHQPAFRAYPELYSLIGPAVPDFRGLFLRGYGSQVTSHYGTVVHQSAALGVLQGDAIREISGDIGGTYGDSGSASGPFRRISRQFSAMLNSGNDDTYNQNFSASSVVPVADEIRPANRAVRYLIRALP